MAMCKEDNCSLRRDDENAIWIFRFRCLHNQKAMSAIILIVLYTVHFLHSQKIFWFLGSKLKIPSWRHNFTTREINIGSFITQSETKIRILELHNYLNCHRSSRLSSLRYSTICYRSMERGCSNKKRSLLKDLKIELRLENDKKKMIKKNIN